MRHYFKDKRVLIMGLGLHGGGRTCAQWFARHGARVIVTDIKSESELLEPIKELASESGIVFHLGGHREEDFRSADLVIQNPGVPRESPYLTIARDHGIPVENEATIFFSYTPKTPKICVTGTRGKSTTTAMIGAMIGAWNEGAIVAGIATRNGARTLMDCLDTVTEREEQGIIAPVILELSSWQIELFTSAHVPAIAIVTNMLPDHLNRYPSMEAYARAKSLLFAGQTEHQAIVLNYDNATTLRWGLGETRGTRYWFTRGVSPIDRGTCVEKIDGTPMILWKQNKTKEAIMPVADVRCQGEHQLENALAAVAGAKVWGVPNDMIARALREFSGIPDRTEVVSRAGERIWINDTTATTPEATAAALKSISTDAKVILIAGGADKQLDYSSLAPLIAERAASVILLSGTATPRLAAAIEAVGAALPLKGANSMRDAVLEAWRQSEKGDTILLSPAAASFGMFVHEFDRGRQFIEEITLLTRA